MTHEIAITLTPSEKKLFIERLPCTGLKKQRVQINPEPAYSFGEVALNRLFGNAQLFGYLFV